MTRADPPPFRPTTSLFAGLDLPPGQDLVARGGSLDPADVLDGYRHGIFPWYDEHDPIYWWSPDPRAVLPLDGVHVPRRLARTLAADRFEIRLDTAFEEVLGQCADAREGGTWIHPEMIDCYRELHRLGVAHSLEVYRADRLVGGIYGVAFGGGFAGESMFHRERDASKVALVALARHLHARGYELFDVQFVTEHLRQFGVVEIPRARYREQVFAVRDRPVRFLAS